MDEKHELKLRIPPTPEHVSTARLFVAAVARQFDMDEDLIEDFRVAISEACNGAIQASVNGGSFGIEIDLGVSKDRILVEVSAPGALPEIAPNWDPKTPTEQFQHTLGIGLMTALFDDSRWENQEESLKISFSVPLSAEK